MKLLFIFLFCIITNGIFAQSDSLNKGTFWKPNPRNYQVKQAVEFESLFPMFLTGGFHGAVCYRYEKFRFRFSVINGGKYDAETVGFKNSSDQFKRFYKTSPGFFFGYNLWKNLELYTYLEFHTFKIEQKSSGITQNLHSTDSGLGISYQFFIGHYVYLQPGFHIYLRKDNSLNFNQIQYNIPNIDLSPVIRVGLRCWRK